MANATKKCFSTLLTKTDTYGSGGQDVHGNGGVGANAHTSQGYKILLHSKKSRSKLICGKYETITNISHTLHNHTQVLGYLMELYVVHRLLNKRSSSWYVRLRDNATRFISQFQRTDFHLNGDIDEFWCGGDEHKWMYMRQKSTGMLWVNDGNYGTYGGRGTRSQNGYWYNSGIHGMMSHLRGPKYVRYIAGMNENRGDGSYQYEFSNT